MIIENIKTPILASCDVLICGGGFAGISSAIAAARQGKKVILLERQCVLGGLGTAGLIAIYLPLCDGMGRQVSYGIAEELFRLSISMGQEKGCHYPENWLDSNDKSKRTNQDKRFEVQYNPQLFAILAEKLLLNEGVEILYGTYAVAVDKQDDKINAVIIENKSGRSAIAVKSVVDATGDCDIANFCDMETKISSKGNSWAAWYYYLSEKDGYKLNMLSQIGCDNEAENNIAEKRYSGIDAKEISEMICFSHSQILKNIIQKRQTDPTVIPVTIATMPQIRMTRKIVGEYTLDESEVHKYFNDSVGMVSDWRNRGPVFEIPFSTLFSSKVRNLIVAGRCISVTDDMWDIMRVIPCCAVTGQAAGTAAAISDDFLNIDLKKLQQILTKDGVILHEKDLI